MIVCYLRSSSYSKLDWCEQAYALNYVLNIPEKANQKAEKGNIVHKALELIALAADAVKNGKKDFDAEELGKVKVKNCEPNHAIRLAYDYYLTTTIFDYTDKDFEECKSWMHKALDYKGGMFDPRKMNILNSEVVFDLTLEQDWATYKHELPDGQIIEGKYGLKGTIDVVAKCNEDVLEILDWKTGRRWDWNLGKEKNYNELKKDPQFLLYYYVARQLYPQFKHIMVTIYFINDGGPYTIYLDDEDYVLAEQMIRKRFERIENIKRPKLNIGWKCTKLCHYGKTMFDEKDTICEHYRKEFLKADTSEVLVQLNPNLKHLTNYGDGGGRQK